MRRALILTGVLLLSLLALGVACNDRSEDERSSNGIYDADLVSQYSATLGAMRAEMQSHTQDQSITKDAMEAYHQSMTGHLDNLADLLHRLQDQDESYEHYGGMMSGQMMGDDCMMENETMFKHMEENEAGCKKELERHMDECREMETCDTDSMYQHDQNMDEYFDDMENDCNEMMNSDDQNDQGTCH